MKSVQRLVMMLSVAGAFTALSVGSAMATPQPGAPVAPTAEYAPKAPTAAAAPKQVKVALKKPAAKQVKVGRGVPEFDVKSSGAALALLGGAVAVMLDRRRTAKVAV